MDENKCYMSNIFQWFLKDRDSDPRVLFPKHLTNSRRLYILDFLFYLCIYS